MSPQFQQMVFQFQPVALKVIHLVMGKKIRDLLPGFGDVSRLGKKPDILSKRIDKTVKIIRLHGITLVEIGS